MIKKQTLTYLLLAFIINVAHCQSITPFLVSTTGSDTSCQNYSLSYSTGELAVTTLHSHSHYLTEGFLQTFPEPFIEVPAINNISINPNPFHKDIEVCFYISEPSDFRVDIYNLCGKKIYGSYYEDVLYGDMKKIDLAYLPRGFYLIRVYSLDGRISKIFKIEKM